MFLPQDNLAYRFPVSVKGVLLIQDKVVLLQNERDEWELPGGKLELDEDPESCVAREIEEELGLIVSVGTILDTWVYHIADGVVVLIITYGCKPKPSEISHSSEHKAVGLFSLDEINGLNMPDGYKKSIRSWLEICRKETSGD